MGLWGFLLIAVGFMLALFGRKLFKPTICLLGTAAFVFVSLLFFYSVFFNANTKTWLGWLVLIISVIIGTVVGLLLAKTSRIGVAVLSGWGGLCLGLVLYSAFLYKTESQVVFWLFIIGMTGLFAGLSFVIFDHILIASTSMIGSYAFVRGISFFAGKYPNEFTLAEMIKSGLYTEIDPIFYLYFIAIIVIFVLSAFVQFKIRQKDQAEENIRPYHSLR